MKYKVEYGKTIFLGNGDFVGLEDKCGEKCDVRSGVCKDVNDGSLIETDACSANHPCYPGCWKTCDNEPSANYCPGKLAQFLNYKCNYR